MSFYPIKASIHRSFILRHFDPNCHIWIETDASGYAISNMLNQLTNLGWWHPVAYYCQKIIPAKTRYKTHDAKLSAIIEAFQIWQHYLKGCKHKVLVLTNHNNLCCFMKTKSLSFRQIWWAQELSQYLFQIDYCQNKANGAADALSRFFQRSDDKKKKLWAKNSQIFHQLQSLVTNANLLGLSFSGLNTSASSNLLPLYQVFIYGTHELP